MIYPKASAKLKIPPWVPKNMTPLAYFAREQPLVFFSTIIAFSAGLPALGYMYMKMQTEPTTQGHNKAYYSIYRPVDYPQELHKYCRKD